MVLPYIAGGFLSNIVVGLINGSKTRELQRDLHNSNLAQASLNRAEDIKISKERFQAEQNFRNEQFNFQKIVEARRNAQFYETMEFQKQIKTDDRAENMLSRVFNGSIEGVWEKDPYAYLNTNLQSLRVFIQAVSNSDIIINASIDRTVSNNIKKYNVIGADYPVYFPTGVWNKKADAHGSWVSAELYNYNPAIPTLMLRAVKISNNSVAVQVDIFGFSMNNCAYQENIDCGEIPNDPETISQMFSLLTLAVSDMYYMSTCAKKPLLPYLLGGYANDMKDEKMIEQIVSAYQVTVNQLLAEDFGNGLYAALNLAEGLAALPNKNYALNQIKFIENLSTDLYFDIPQLPQVLQDLYVQVGAPNEALRLEQQQIKKLTKINTININNIWGGNNL